MASYEQEGRPLPKFGEWDVNDPASAEGFTVIFNKARDDKKTGAGSVRVQSQRRNNSRKEEDKSAKVRMNNTSYAIWCQKQHNHKFPTSTCAYDLLLI
ncbi:uncharacterized protein LOC124831475 isoform X1 [Vigna umbellata]|uniref:uncharacterized protein LOC124831475 isoform X1 n=1 Tax=Vigna umbellata TaxID=87088 RepID=UPI001F5EE4AB|nr:uncharacterized protein LOC124831475 isoform X1 [Vigna umbellata]